MTRTFRLIAAMLAVLALFGLAGCDQTRAANEAISAANELAEKYAALDNEIAALMDEATTADMTPEGVKPGIEAIDAAAAKFEERKAITEAVRAEFMKIAGYDVKPEVKEYAAQQVEIAEMLGQMDDLGLELIASTKALYQLIESGSTDANAASELSIAIEESSSKLTELDKQVTEKQAASEKYFIDSGLGQ